MDNSAIFAHVDHTLLRATATWKEVEELCRQAVLHKTASVCVLPSYVERVRQAFGDIVICTVVGFPLGANTTQVKGAEILTADKHGADEFDVVVNLGDAKNGNFAEIADEIGFFRKLCGGKILKVIVETCYLTTDEKIAMCKAVTHGGADYIKTSTGFGDGGATMDDVLLFKEHLGPGVKIKASGGIKSRDDMVAFIQAGCERLGTSSAVKILTEDRADGDY